MNGRLKDWPLSVKLWSIFAALTLCIFIMLAMLLPWLLKGFFTDQLYDILVDSQSSVQLRFQEPGAAVRPAEPLTIIHELAGPAAGPDEADSQSGREEAPAENEPLTRVLQAPAPDELTELSLPGTDGERARMAMAPGQQMIRVQRKVQGELQPGAPKVRHLILNGEAGSWAEPAAASDPFIAAVEQDALAQDRPLEKYTVNINDQSLFYVIRKEQVAGETGYLVSYATSSYRNDLVKGMFLRLMLLMVGLIVVSWLPCLALARYLTSPLVQMERHVGRLAERDWHEPLVTRRRDEIGRLAEAIEGMRQRLVRQDKAQQHFLQNISHELKTPVMVIRSYVESIRDGIFPKGSMHGSLHVIEQEAERLELKIRELLLLSKLSYMSSRERQPELFQLAPMVADTVQRLRFRRPDIRWEVEVAEAAVLHGDPQQWSVALENLLDNQLRYARSVIRLTAGPGRPPDGAPNPAVPVQPEIRIANDGPPLDEEVLSGLFEPFQAGTNGQFGLGLMIVRQIAASHGMMVRAANESDGAAFYLEPEAYRQEKAG